MVNDIPFAVFVLVRVDGGYAATTRIGGGIGLPGGKIDAGETAVSAVIREAHEEGWDVSGVSTTPIQTRLVDGKVIQWFVAETAVKLANYKEIGRIKNIVATAEQITKSGFGNEGLKL